MNKRLKENFLWEIYDASHEFLGVVYVPTLVKDEAFAFAKAKYSTVKYILLNENSI